MLENILKTTSLVQIAVLYLLCYAILKYIKGTRGAALLKALIFVLIIAIVGLLFIADKLKLYHLKQMFELILSGSFIALLVIFAPEIRRMLLKLSESPILSPFFSSHASMQMIGEIGKAVEEMARKRFGAIIAIEREVGLSEYAESGVNVDAAVTADLLETLFYPGSPTHDGAVVIKDERIVTARCLFPLTETQITSSDIGTRHRAAIGVSEETDAIVIVVSEETGTISLCAEGRITRGLDRARLEKMTDELYRQKKIIDQLKRNNHAGADSGAH